MPEDGEYYRYMEHVLGSLIKCVVDGSTRVNLIRYITTE